MTTAITNPPISIYKKFIRDEFKAELHQPVPEELINQLISSINKESEVLLVDAGCLIALSLIENGHNPDKIFVAEGFDGLYKTVAEAASQRYGFHCIGLSVNQLSSIMKFDYILGNPPFQSEKGGGSLRGSTSAALWFQIVINSLEFLKPGGEIKFITPTPLFSGGDVYRSLFVGTQSKYDVVSVNFDTNDYFPNVGTEMCHWHIRNTCTPNFLTTVDGNRQVNLKQSYFLTSDSNFDEIVHTLANLSEDKLNFNQNNSYDSRAVSRYIKTFNFDTSNRYDSTPVKNYIKKNNLDVSEKCQETVDEIYKYPVSVNGKIKYGAVEWKDVGVWRIFLPWMPPKGQATYEISKEWSAAPSTLTMKFASEEECLNAYEILNTPEYRWIVSQTVKNGRVNPAIINLLPIAPVSEFLSEEQLNYIQSQL
jgi:hypothetical protein